MDSGCFLIKQLGDVFLKKVFAEHSGDPCSCGTDEATSGFDASAAHGSAVFETVAKDTDEGNELGRVAGLGHDIDTIGHAHACGHFKYGFGEVSLVFYCGRTAREDNAPHEIAHECALFQVLSDFAE